MSTKKPAKTAEAPIADATEGQASTLSAGSVGTTIPPVIPVTVGRRLHFFPNQEHQESLGVFDAQQPCDAGVIYVWGDREVNLDVTGPSGVRHSLQNVRLLQGDDQPNEGESYAAWMSYQLNQAAKAA